LKSDKAEAESQKMTGRSQLPLICFVVPRDRPKLDHGPGEDATATLAASGFVRPLCCGLLRPVAADQARRENTETRRPTPWGLWGTAPTETGRDRPRQAATGRDRPQQAATGRDRPQHAATCRNMPQHAATCSNRPQQAATCRDRPQQAATGRNRQQTGRNMPQHATTCRNMPQHAATGWTAPNAHVARGSPQS
jgi:hypothetical protein